MSVFSKSSRLSHEDIVALHMKFLLDATVTSRLLLNPRLSLDNSYSDGPLSKYDVYFPFKEYVSSLTPILIYIHGGYWTMISVDLRALSMRSRSRSRSCYLKFSRSRSRSRFCVALPLPLVNTFCSYYLILMDILFGANIF